MTPGTGSNPQGLGSLADERLGAVVAAMARREARPAAGSAVAVTLSMSAALLEKAASALNNGVPVDSAAQGRAEHLRTDALVLADNDAATFRLVLAARGDAARVRSALAQAAEPVLAMAEIGVTLARLADRLLDDVPPRLQGEVRTAEHLACAATHTAAELVAIDLGELSKDPRAARAFELAAEAAAHELTLAERPLRRR
ncbi:MAG TPA: cyclodeaminase/cyclohydrolase family protein [Solirubrobacteraceae bacterium]|nr:cyclodeaminase/cyclohydrolase family protein [Solirubrobacteraceae bacterium]